MSEPKFKKGQYIVTTGGRVEQIGQVDFCGEVYTYVSKLGGGLVTKISREHIFGIVRPLPGRKFDRR